MVSSADRGLTMSSETGEDQGGRGAEIGGDHMAGDEAINTIDRGGLAAALNVSAHASELFEMGEALGENVVGDGALAIGNGG